MKPEPGPNLSVVVASGAGGEFLWRCLDSLSDQAARAGAEVIVVDRCGAARQQEVSRRYPGVRVVAWSGGDRPSVPQLRALGVDACRAPIVAVIEEHCVAAPDWMATILANFTAGDAAVGGPMFDDDYRRTRDWVVYFSEYHKDLPPWPEGERAWINDANAAYARPHLVQHRAGLGDSYWTVSLHPRLAASGARMRALPTMCVRHTGPFDYGYYLRQRYLLSRLWGGTARAGLALPARLVCAARAPLLPPLLLWRMARQVMSRPRYRAPFLLALPMLLPVVFAYAVGEFLGYLAGPGNALAEVE